MDLLIKPFSSAVAERYRHHRHFHDGDAGLDLFIIDEETIQAGETVLIHHQIACETADGRPYWLMPRSSISKTPLRMANSIGLIDGGYRGEIMAAVDNISSKPFTVRPGQRLFQLVSMTGEPIHFKLTEHLSVTGRGSGGFGSTGK